MISTIKIPSYLDIALREVGTKEIKGLAHNNRILEYHSTCELKATSDETPWCSAFVNWCLKEAGFTRTKSAAATSWLGWGYETTSPKLGDIVVFRVKNSPWQGHVGFYICHKGDKVLVLGGNQSNQVCFQWYSVESDRLYLSQYRTGFKD